MKPPLSVPISRGINPLVIGLRKRLATVLIATMVTGLGAGAGFTQGPPPGNFYQFNPPGQQITGATFNELSYVNGFLASAAPATPPYSLYNPVPAGYQAATPAALAAAVTAATNNFLSASPTTPIPAGVTLASIATELTANNYTVATGATASTGSLAALTASVIANQSTANAQTSLSSVLSALAKANPTTIASLSSPIFTGAAANASLATSIPQLALAATTATSSVASNDQTIGAIVTQAINAVATSASPQQTTLQNIVAAQYGSPLIYSSQASVAAVAKSMLSGSAVAVVPTLNQPAYVQSAVNALPAGAQTNVNIGSIYLGMIASGSLPESAVVTDLQGASSASGGERSYLTALDVGYNSTAGNIANNIASNPSMVDAIVSGAISSGTVPYATVVTDGVSASGGTALQNIVAAAITADMIKNSADNAPTIAAAAVAATSTANFAAVAQGAVGGGRTPEAGTIIASMIKASPGYSPMYSTLNQSTFTASNVQSLVSGALTGAYGGAYGTSDINSKPGAIAQIVYQSEAAASNFSGATAAQYTSNILPIAEAVATQAVTSLKNLDTVDAELPTYIVAAAAFAGYGGSPSDLPAIQNALTSVPGVGSYSSTNAINAINAVEPLVQNYKTLSSQGYTQSLAAFGSNASASDTVMAILYGASLSSPVDASALLAAAVGKVPSALVSNAADSDANLLAAAIYANPLNQAKLTIANTVALHIATNLAANNNNDISNYVGYQTAQNPAYVVDIATAAVAVDPNQANYVARAIAYNSPTTAYTAIPSIFAYSQLTSKPNNSNPSQNIDEASAAAAISAGYAAGLVQAANLTTLTPSASNTVIQQALVNGVSQAVGAAVQQNATRLTGASFLQAPTSVGRVGPQITVNMTTGVPSYSGTINSSPAVGSAGVVTGIIAQFVKPGDTTFASNDSGNQEGAILNTSESTGAQIVKAILQATVFTVQNGAPTTTLGGNQGLVTQIAQAAGQAFGYVSGINVGNPHAANLSQAQEVAAANNIAGDLTTSASASNYNLVLFAAYFGITQGQAGNLGAGSTGISFLGPYSQNGSTVGNAVTGAPVTDIFNL